MWNIMRTFVTHEIHIRARNLILTVVFSCMCVSGHKNGLQRVCGTNEKSRLSKEYIMSFHSKIPHRHHTHTYTEGDMLHLCADLIDERQYGAYCSCRKFSIHTQQQQKDTTHSHNNQLPKIYGDGREKSRNETFTSLFWFWRVRSYVGFIFLFGWQLTSVSP